MQKIFKTIKALATPQKIQDFLDLIPFNFELKEESYWSPKIVLMNNKMHCFEGALFACACFQKNHIRNYLMDLKVKDLKKDSDHTLCIYELNGFWGSVSKTNHSVLRFRDPIYKSPRELAMSYFHEYFLDSGEKTLISHSKPFDVWKKFGDTWIDSDDDLDEIAEALDRSPHLPFVPKINQKYIRKAGKVQIKGAGVVEWSKKGKRSIV